MTHAHTTLEVAVPAAVGQAPYVTLAVLLYCRVPKFSPYGSVLYMRSKAWLAAPVPLAHAEATKAWPIFVNGSKT